MTKITLYSEKWYYLSKYGEKEYLNGSNEDKTLLEAAILTGRGLKKEENIEHVIYADSEENARKSEELFRKENPQISISKREEFTN